MILILAAIIGTSAFLQADTKGWWLLLGGVGLCLIGWIGLDHLRGVLFAENFSKVLANPDHLDGIKSMMSQDLRGFALKLVFFAGIVMTFGVAAGALFGRWFSPGKVGGAMFVAAYFLINILIYTLAAGS